MGSHTILYQGMSERNETASPETEENEAEILLGGHSGAPADDSDSDSSLTEAISVTSEVPREEPSGSPTGEAAFACRSWQPGRRWAK